MSPEPKLPALRTLIMREMCWKRHPSCKKCPYWRGCLSRATNAQDAIKQIYFVTPKHRDSLAAVAASNDIEQAELLSSETID